MSNIANKIKRNLFIPNLKNIQAKEPAVSIVSKVSCDFFWIIFFFNRDLSRGCFVYMFSLHFSGSKVLINLRQ